MEKTVSRIKKRDGNIADFVQNKITNAIYKAMESHGLTDNGAATTVSDIVTFMLEEKFGGYTIPSVEQLMKPPNNEVEYVFWPFWNSGLLFTENNVDLSAHNQRAFVEKYGEKIYQRFPSLLSYYFYYTKYFAFLRLIPSLPLTI